MQAVTKGLAPETEHGSIIMFMGEESRCTALFEKVTLSEWDHVFVYLKDSNVAKNIHVLEENQNTIVTDAKEIDNVELVSLVVEELGNPSEIVLDISILNKPELLLLLRALDLKGLLQRTRIIYTEPDEYLSTEKEITSEGIQRIDSVPGFTNVSSLNRQVLLILILGFEPPRSTAIYNMFDPDKTFLMTPSPAYYEGLEGRTEKKNSSLIKEVGENHLFEIPSRNPTKFIKEMNRFLLDNNIVLGEWNSFISPLGTKPQTLALYYLWRNRLGDFSIIHSSPLEKNKLYVASGISTTWELLEYED